MLAALIETLCMPTSMTGTMVSEGKTMTMSATAVMQDRYTKDEVQRQQHEGRCHY